MIELQLAEKQNFENLKYKKNSADYVKSTEKICKISTICESIFLIFGLPSSDFIQSQFRFLRFRQELQNSIFHQVLSLIKAFLEIQFHGFFLELNSTKSLLVSR